MVVLWLATLAGITVFNWFQGVAAAPWWFYVCAILMAGFFWAAAGIFKARGNWTGR